MLFGWPPLLARCVYVDMHLYYAAVQNGCGNVRLTTAESSDTPSIHCAQHVQFVDMSIQLPAGLQYDPVQMAEVVQQEYVIGAWL